MKKILAILPLAVLIVLTGCTAEKESNVTTDPIVPEVVQGGEQNKPVSSVENELQNVNLADTEEVEGIHAKEDVLVLYRNESCGFEMMIPEHWIVNDYICEKDDLTSTFEGRVYGIEFIEIGGLHMDSPVRFDFSIFPYYGRSIAEITDWHHIFEQDKKSRSVLMFEDVNINVHYYATNENLISGRHIIEDNSIGWTYLIASTWSSRDSQSGTTGSGQERVERFQKIFGSFRMLR